ncbi:MAG: methyltransferase domain-containing protein [Planctomycetota bacterium]|nr:MAG: methyltransferase domain-containing protein [Planctomycetota bacterium]
METRQGLPDLAPETVAGAVAATYAAGARAVQPELCCPVEYDPKWLAAIPAEVLERDYGCGDPSRWLRPGETVLDLGSGGGKICFIASQVVGPEGRVIGVDMTPDMLELARRARPEVARRVGWDNVEFRRGRIEDLALDLEKLEEWLIAHPVRDLAGYSALLAETERLRREEPMVPDDSIDVVVSNCVLNLVAPGAKERLFAELHRVLRPGGRAVISDIVASQPVPAELQRDPELWSGCISGALEEGAFRRAFAAAGLDGLRVLARGEEPWRVVAGIEFRSLTVAAWKPPVPVEAASCCAPPTAGGGGGCCG